MGTTAPFRIEPGGAGAGTTRTVAFFVPGSAVPKQSFRVDARRRVRGYRSARVTAWQQTVAWHAREAMRGDPPLSGAVRMRLEFVLPSRRRVDLDNLSKAVLDALNGIVWHDDRQVTRLELSKRYDGDCGVHVAVQAVDGDATPA